MRTTLDEMGRLTLPQEICRRLGVGPGTVLEIEQREWEVRLRPVEGDVRLVKEGNVLIISGGMPMGVEDVRSTIEATRDQRTRETAGLDQ